MAASFGVGARVSAAVFSDGFGWLTKGPFTSPEKAVAAVARAKWPKGRTNTAGALTKALSNIQRHGSKGAKQIVYVITDGVPNSINATTAASAKLRKAARLAFIPVGKSAPVSRMQSWASKPTSENVFYAKDFKALKYQLKKAVKSTCNNKAKAPKSKDKEMGKEIKSKKVKTDKLKKIKEKETKRGVLCHPIA